VAAWSFSIARSGTRAIACHAEVTGVSAWEPYVEDLALPKSLESGNFTLAKAVIRWMSVRAARKAGVR
jgi:hypothetical protein